MFAMCVFAFRVAVSFFRGLSKAIDGSSGKGANDQSKLLTGKKESKK